jgi:hypothetical protein
MERQSLNYTYLNTIATAFLANVDETTTALRDVPVMPCVTHLAPEASSRLPKVDTLEAARVFAFVVISKLGEDLVDSFAPLVREEIGRRISLHNLFGALFNAVDVCGRAGAGLPRGTADVAEFGAARAAANR